MNMRKFSAASAALRILLTASAALLAACGQTGGLYLPDSRQGTVVTRPAGAPPPAGDDAAGNSSPTTVDSPPQPPSPAPEVTAPQGTEQDQRKPDKKNGAPPRPQQ